MKPIFILTVIFTFSCQNSDKNDILVLEEINPFPVVIDTVNSTYYIPLLYKNECNRLSTSNYDFFFIGSIKDTVYLNPLSYNFTSSNLNYKDSLIELQTSQEQKRYYVEWMDSRIFKNWTESKIEIRTDIGTKFSGFFPVLLKNTDNDTIVIANENDIPLTMEAMDSSGNWRPIQEIQKFACGFGIGRVILPPGESALTLAPVFRGEFRTKLRLTIGKNHSDPFPGNIHYTQFQKN